MIHYKQFGDLLVVIEEREIKEPPPLFHSGEWHPKKCSKISVHSAGGRIAETSWRKWQDFEWGKENRSFGGPAFWKTRHYLEVLDFDPEKLEVEVETADGNHQKSVYEV